MSDGSKTVVQVDRGPGIRALVVTNGWPRGDAPYRGIWVARQVDDLRRAGVDVGVLEIRGYQSRANYARAALEIVRLGLQKPRFDVVHAHTGHSGFLACLQFRYPVVFTYHGYDLDVPAEDRDNWRTHLERFVFRHLSMFVAATIVQSQRSSQAVPRLGRSRNFVLPNGVDRRLFSPVERSAARERLGWDPERPIVLFAADPSRYTKNYGLARAALEHVRQSIPDVELTIGMSVPSDEMSTWMSAADALLLTSVAEAGPVVVKEAMACDLPIVGVDVGDVRSVIEGTRHCYVCASEPTAVGEALVQVLSHRGERSDGRARSGRFDAGVVAEQLKDVYRFALRRGPGPLGFLARRWAEVAPSRAAGVTGVAQRPAVNGRRLASR